MKQIRLVCRVLLLLTFVTAALTAHASTPLDWHQFIGAYDFGKCENQGEPIWDEDTSHFAIGISIDPYNTGTVIENQLVLLLIKKSGPSLIVPSWEVSGIGQAPQKMFDDKTGAVTRIQTSYVTDSSLVSSIYWHFDSDSGFASLVLSLTQDGTVSYEMIQTVQNGQKMARERCALTRRKRGSLKRYK